MSFLVESLVEIQQIWNRVNINSFGMDMKYMLEELAFDTFLCF